MPEVILNLLPVTEKEKGANVDADVVHLFS